MSLGLSLQALTQIHVAISLIGIFAGLVFFVALTGGRWLSGWNTLFLAFTILTSVTGFFFPPKPIGPPFIFGVISLISLGITLFALYGKHRVGGWRIVALGTALLAQYLNMVVLIVQTYQKIPFFNALAPTGTEPAFLATQGMLLIATIWTGWRVLRRSP